MLIAQMEPLVVMILVGILLVFILFAVAAAQLFTPWLQAFLAGAPVSLIQIVGMRLRRVDVRLVIKSRIMATQAGVSVSSTDLERAYLQGVDLEKLTLGLIQAQRAGETVTVQELVDADLERRLREKLDM